MDNVRLLLFMALAFLGMLIYQAWQEDYGPRSEFAENAASDSLDSQPPTQIGDTPVAPTTATIDAAVPSASPDSSVAEAGVSANAQLITVQTDMFDLRIDTRGGTIVDAKLMEYPVTVDKPDVKYHLLSQRPFDYFIVQSGLLGQQTDRTPTHEAMFNASASRFELGPDQDELAVELLWQAGDGLEVVKRYFFRRGTHAITLEHEVRNNSDTAWTGREYRQLQRGEPVDSGNMFMYTYTGGAIFSPEDKYQKYDFEDLAKGEPGRDVVDGWISMIQHYFLAAVVPPRGEQQHFYGKGLSNGRAVLGSYTPARAVQPGTEETFTGTLFVGPKLQAELEALAEGLDLTVDYGWLVFIAKPMYWILEQIQSVVQNWGWTIIIFTVLIKLVFFKLSETSYRSMANMRCLSSP